AFGPSSPRPQRTPRTPVAAAGGAATAGGRTPLEHATWAVLATAFPRERGFAAVRRVRPSDAGGVAPHLRLLAVDLVNETLEALFPSLALTEGASVPLRRRLLFGTPASMDAGAL